MEAAGIRLVFGDQPLAPPSPNGSASISEWHCLQGHMRKTGSLVPRAFPSQEKHGQWAPHPPTKEEKASPMQKYRKAVCSIVGNCSRPRTILGGKCKMRKKRPAGLQDSRRGLGLTLGVEGRLWSVVHPASRCDLLRFAIR